MFAILQLCYRVICLILLLHFNDIYFYQVTGVTLLYAVGMFLPINNTDLYPEAKGALITKN